MESLKVEILSRKLVNPSNPTPIHLQNLKLSLFDQLSPPMYVHILFHYLLDEDYNRAKIDERCAQMEVSLSQVLTKYYPLAGRFAKDNLLVDCADQGVEYFEAQVNVKLADFLQKGPEIELLNKFLPWDIPPATCLITSPLLAIQINKFECGGLIVGIRISHTIADACSMMAFIKEWASSTSQTETNKVSSCQSYDHFLSLFPARPQLTLVPKLLQRSKDHSAQIVTARFLFDKPVIVQIAEKAASSSSRWNISHPTRVVVVLALIWKALIGVSLAKHGHLRDSIICLAMNLRGKTALQIAELTYGNFWTPVLVPMEAKNAKTELQDLMILLEDSTRSTREKHAAATNDDISSMLINSSKEVIEKRFLCDDIDVYISTSWCRFPIYEIDFGWGKPYWTSHVRKPFEGIVLMDAKNGYGIEAWISLVEKDMIEFNRQLETLMFVSTLKDHTTSK